MKIEALGRKFNEIWIKIDTSSVIEENNFKKCHNYNELWRNKSRSQI